MKLRKLGRYEILDELGQGAMGIVYRATDPMINRVVAIKTINMALKEDEVAEYEARFYQEAKAAGGLNHPNIVTVYDIGKSGNIAFMTMELLSGNELRALLAPDVPLPLAQAIDIAAQVADGLAYAHEHQVVHRDIKPANIMIVRDGVVKITDFGIARMRFSKTFTQTGTIVGSPRYMSPEQVLGKRTGPQSDIFSLGAVLYEMLTGRAPFTGSDVNALMFQILNLVPPVPSALNPAVPELLNLVVAKALAKAPDERYASAAELAEDLRGCRKLVEEAKPAAAEAADAPMPAQAKIDQESGVALRVAKVPGTRREDVEHEVNEPAPTLGVAKAFDSLEATMRLATQTGIAEEMEDYARTQRFQRLQEGSAEASFADTAPGPHRSGLAAARWSRNDRLTFAAGIVVALLVSMGIAFY
jgi:eukaryotic-like serine/threonine-protein kinase